MNLPFKPVIHRQVLFLRCNDRPGTLFRHLCATKTNHVIRKRTFLAVTLLTISIFGHAQDSTLSLDPVTVTATLQSLPVSRTGRNISIIPGAFFQQLPVRSLDELLRYVPGVEIQQRGPAGSQSDIVLRGGTFQQVLVVLDGIRLNDPNTGHFSSYIPIAPAEIERVEILRGAASAIFGSEAVGGVIHVITKTFAAKKQVSQQQFDVAASGGQYGSYSINAGGFRQKGHTAVAGGFLSNNADGQLQRGIRGFYHNNTGSVSFKQYMGRHWSVAARSAFDQRRFGAQNFYTTFISDTAREKVTSIWEQARLQYQDEKHTLSLDAGYKSVKDRYQYNPLSVANNNRSSLYQLLLTDHFKLTARTTLSSGFQYQQRRIRSNDRGNHDQNLTAIFLILDHQTRHFTFNPSLRVDQSDLRRTELIPQLSMSWHKQRWQIRASGGKTIRDADFTERYNNYNKAFVTGGSIGNPDLTAERSFSYEAGADYIISKTLRVSVSAFQRRQSQLIDFVTTPYSQMPRKVNLSPTGTYALALNIAKVNTSGVEFNVQHDQTIGKTDHVFSTFGLTWLHSEGNTPITSFYLSSHAKWLCNFSTSYQGKKAFISLTGIYKNRTPRVATAIQARVDANIFLLNMQAGYRFLQQRLSVFAEVDNLTDRRAQDLLGSRLPGRWITGGLKVIL